MWLSFLHPENGRNLRHEAGGEGGCPLQGAQRREHRYLLRGGTGRERDPADTRTAEQKNAMKWLLETLKREFDIKHIGGHRDFSPDLDGDGMIEPEEWVKECPCFDVKEWLENGC